MSVPRLCNENLSSCRHELVMRLLDHGSRGIFVVGIRYWVTACEDVEDLYVGCSTVIYGVFTSVKLLLLLVVIYKC